MGGALEEANHPASSRSNFYKRKLPIEKIMEEERSRKINEIEADIKRNSAKRQIYRALNYVWLEFSLLEQAFCCIQEKNRPNLRIFSREKFREGTTSYSFIVTNIESFWLEYSQIQEYRRHFYEVIIDKPCRFYADLEYEYSHNPESDGDLMTRAFMDLVISQIKRFYGVAVSREDFLWMNSSSVMKYSAHLVLFGGRVLFQNNLAIKDLMRCCQEVAEKKHPSLMVYKSAGEKIFFADQCVYSKNRSFRLYLSSKINKGINLTVCEHSTHLLKNVDSANQQKSEFLASLVIPENCSNAQILQPSALKSFSTVLSKRAAQSSRIRQSEHVNDLQIYLNYHVDIILHKALKIRALTHYPSKKYIKCDIYGSRYCYRIGREHKSNGVYLIINLLNNCIYQMCYDSDCRSFVSEALITLPTNIIETVLSKTQKCESNGSQSKGSDGELQAAADELEKSFV